MAADVEAIIERHKEMRRRRQFWETRWQDVADYIHIRRAQFTARSQPGAKRTGKMFDSTAVHANELLAASMGGTLTSKANKWFALRMRDDDLNAIDAVGEWLEEAANRLMAAYAQSNFYSEIQEVYLDLGAFGIAGLLAEERPVGSDIVRFGGDQEGNTFTGFVFRALPLNEYAVDEDAEGKVDTVFRVFEISARLAVKRWGLENVGEKVRQAHEKKKDTQFPFLHAVFKREDPKGDELPWASVYIEPKQKHIVDEGGYHEFPYMVPRWSKSSGEIYGRGPGFSALPDVKTLNKATELQLKAWGRDVFPPLEVPDDGTFGRVRLTPGAQNPVRVSGSIKPITSGARWDVSQIKNEELRKSIRNIFFSDQLQFQNTQIMTATEAELRFELMQRLLGPTAGRIESELLSPLIDRTFAIMLRASALPPVPDELQEAQQGGEVLIDVEYEGPLARAQRGRELAAGQRFFAGLAPLVQVNPAIMDRIDPDGYTEWLAETTGVPKKILRPDQEVDAIREARQREADEEQQKQDLERVAEGAGKLAPALAAVQGNGGG